MYKNAIYDIGVCQSVGELVGGYKRSSTPNIFEDWRISESPILGNDSFFIHILDKRLLSLHVTSYVPFTEINFKKHLPVRWKLFTWSCDVLELGAHETFHHIFTPTPGLFYVYCTLRTTYQYYNGHIEKWKTTGRVKSTTKWFSFRPWADIYDSYSWIQHYFCCFLLIFRFFFLIPSSVSLPINQSLHSRIRGEADLLLGSNCNSSDNDSIKVSYDDRNIITYQSLACSRFQDSGENGSKNVAGTLRDAG